MSYTDSIQDETIRFKLKAFLEVVAEIMCDNDEALDKRYIDDMDHLKGFQITMPANLRYYWSTGTGSDMMDMRIESILEYQAEEWARQYPHRASLSDCCDDESEFSDEAQNWEIAAFDDEYIYMEIEGSYIDDEIVFSSCFIDEINRPLTERHIEKMDMDRFLTLKDDDLKALANGLAESPYKAEGES